MEPASLLAYLKLPIKILAGVGLMASGILFLPASWVAALGLTQIRSNYQALLGGAILLAVAVLIIEGITFFYRWLRDRERPTPYDGYRTDEFFGLRWRWSWYARDVVGVHAFCPACDLQLEGRTQTAGIMDVPTGEVLYYCPCGATAIKLKCADPLQVERAIGLHAEREARSRGLLRD